MEDQPNLNDVLARIRAYRREFGLSYSALALSAKLSRAALMGMDAEDWGPTSDTIRAIEALIPPKWEPGKAAPARRPRTPASHRDGRRRAA